VETVCDAGSTNASGGTGVAVAVLVGVEVSVGVNVSVGVAVSVGVDVAVPVAVAVGVSVSVAVGSGVGVSVAVGSGVEVSVAVSVAVPVGVAVAVAAATVTLPSSGSCAVSSVPEVSRSSSAETSMTLMPSAAATKVNAVSIPEPSAPGFDPVVVQLTETVPVSILSGSQITVRPVDPRKPPSIASGKVNTASSKVTV
jgi:hypothetical protein